ncbi:MAG: transcription antitermination factor NusB [Ruminococcaceae bacterium]|nr:transcription antitermination factor NusB [Oscillospiraceae bacterium]
MNRKTARENAFILIFERCFREDSVEAIIEDAIEAREFEYDDYVELVFKGVCEKSLEIDEVIIANLKGWNINRLSKVALSLLRLAIYEMLYVDSIPVKVSINEAVEIAKKYSTQEDAAYINGVLGSVAANIEK